MRAWADITAGNNVTPGGNNVAGPSAWVDAQLSHGVQVVDGRQRVGPGPGGRGRGSGSSRRWSYTRPRGHSGQVCGWAVQWTTVVDNSGQQTFNSMQGQI